MKYEHIIWDWNGTLLDDVADCAAVVDNLMQKNDLGQLSIDRYRQETCFPVINFYIALGFDFDKITFEDMANDYISQYLAKLPEMKLHEGSSDSLSILTENGYTHSVLSAYHQQRLEEAIEHFGLTSYFSKIIGLDDYYARSKVENGKKWISELPYEPSKVLFIGDTLHDHEVAEAIGVDCVLLTSGHQNRNILSRAGCRMADSLKEITDWLLDQ